MKNELTKIYTIFTFEKLNEQNKYDAIQGDRRLWGFYSDINRSREVVEHNISNIHEYLYDYAIVEELEEGPTLSNKRLVFKWSKHLDKFVEIKEPECFKNTYNITMG